MQGREYDYIRGNTAVAPSRRTEEKEYPRKVKKHKKSKNLKKALEKKNERKFVLKTVGLIISLGCVTIALDGKVYNMQKQVSSLEKQIKSTNEDNEALKVKILKYSSLSNIGDSAESKLAMYIPQSEDVVKIDFSENYFKDVNKANDEVKKGSWFSKLTNLLNK